MGLLDRLRSTARRLAGRSPNQAEASRLIDEGNALEDAGRIGEAMQRYDESIRLMPGLARAHLNRGNILLATGDARAALDAYLSAVAHEPHNAAAHYNAGNAQVRLGYHQAALGAYAEAIRLKPDFVDAEVALGNAQEDLGLLVQAEASYRRALALRPEYAEVYYNLAKVLLGLGQLDRAEQCCRRALALRPGLAEAHQNLGLVLLGQQRRTEAEAAFRQALAHKPGYGSALAEAYHCANHLCSWSRRKEDEDRLLALVDAGQGGIPPFHLLSMDRPDNAGKASFQRRAGLLFATEKLGSYLTGAAVSAAGHPERDRLRIGYLSADFYDHATMHLLQGVLEAHDRERFAIHGYSYGSTPDQVTQKAAQCCDVFRDFAALSNADAAALIAADGIDILVDLKGYTQNTRIEISAQRPAPVIVSWLGYPGTLGHPRLADYLIGDPIVSPPRHAEHFSETLALMPHCYQPNDRERAIAATPRRAEVGLPDSGFVFCSFNQSYKFNPESFDAWCRLLAEVPGSILWLLAPTEPAVANLRREARSRGVAPERLVFAPRKQPAEHLGRLRLADLALDTFPCTSHTTGSDALWAGVPLVTRMGETFASRVAASLLHAAGLPELATRSRDDCFAVAKGLALAPQRLEAVRQKLADQRLKAPLFDTVRFTRDLERLYRRMWQQHAKGVKEIIILEGRDWLD